ncbi:MAG: flavin reductase family protein [Azoarcus sp.]|jgi:flavin reductase (DIM6/NTAB) family NADH-FMN oxidoreductase RutF|nr:flavin reductase family protein [Azoarcus sp.]
MSQSSISFTAADSGREFRSALGRYATGIAVVTLRTPAGELLGLTVNSFNSVSLAPPLVVWSLSSASSSMAAFEASEYYAINVLAAGQQDLSQRFASRGEERFGGLALDEGLGGAPLLPGCCARFECRNATRHTGGDHVVFIGEVERFDYREDEPLIYFGGAYRRLAA